MCIRDRCSDHANRLGALEVVDGVLFRNGAGVSACRRYRQSDVLLKFIWSPPPSEGSCTSVTPGRSC
eukprot:11635699-Alexandrium_andersonii.AAC.1